MDSSGCYLKTPLKLSDLMQGKTFELNAEASDTNFLEHENLLWEDVNDEDLEKFASPCSSTFAEKQKEMEMVSEGLYKKILQPAAPDAKSIDVRRNRVVYHRNMYIEDESHPFDSTYLNGKSDVLCLALNNDGNYLEGFLEALETMKEGEHSLFLISYMKMFKELGCPPRIKEKADILCDLKVIKVEDVGDQNVIDQLIADRDKPKDFESIKNSIEEAFARANDSFCQGKISQAVKTYRYLRQIVGFSKASSEEEVKNCLDTLVRISLNLAVCYNRQEEWKQTVEEIDSIEARGANIDTNPKAAFTKGKALMMLNETEEASKYLKKAHKLKPQDVQVIRALKQLEDRINSYKTFRTNFAKNLDLK